MDLKRVSGIFLPRPPNNENTGSSRTRHVGKTSTSPVSVESSLLRSIPKLKEDLDSFDVEDNKSKLKSEIQDGYGLNSRLLRYKLRVSHAVDVEDNGIDAEEISAGSRSKKDNRIQDPVYDPQSTRKRISTSEAKSNDKLPRLDIVKSESVSKGCISSTSSLLQIFDKCYTRRVAKSDTKLPSIKKSMIEVAHIACECCPTSMFKDANRKNVYYCSEDCARINYPDMPFSQMEQQRLKTQSMRERTVAIYQALKTASTNNSGIKQIFDAHRSVLEIAACIPAAQSGVKSQNKSIFLPD